MRPGEVVTVRINPTDCMGIADMLALGNVDTTGMSFSQATATVLQSMLESARQQEIIPVRDGFEFNRVMQPFSRKKKGPPKGGLIAAMNQMRESVRTARDIADVMGPAEEITPVNQMTTEQRQAGLRMKELQIKQEHAKDSWTNADQLEWDALYKIVFPEG